MCDYFVTSSFTVLEASMWVKSNKIKLNNLFQPTRPIEKKSRQTETDRNTETLRNTKELNYNS